MLTIFDRENEITTDGKTVWVNSPKGECIGRFSNRGIDVHRTLDDQLKGLSQCLDCCHGKSVYEMWCRFQQSMLKFHRVVIPDDFKPEE
jgi:hypothetical protein